MKKIYPLLIALLFCLNVFAQVDSVYWYVKGQQDYWYIQQDVWAFRMVNGEAWTDQLDNNIVEQCNHREDVQRQLNEIHFKQNTTVAEREQIRNIIRIHPRFDCEFPVITKFRDEINQHSCKLNGLNGGKKNWMLTDDVILVVFHNPDPSSSTVNTFKSKYNLTIVHQPKAALPKVGSSSWTYAFGLNPTICKSRTAISVSAQIYENESSIIKIVEPKVEPNDALQDAAPTGQISIQTADTYYDQAWHIKNTGQCVAGGVTGTNDADCNIEEAWNESTGSGITVAVVDKGIFATNHPDMSGQFLSGYDFIDNDTDVSSCSQTGGHPTSCAGLIGAVANNGLGSVGVAYDVKIRPYITWSADIYKGLQEAFLQDVEIISCSQGFKDWYSATIENDIDKCFDFGRVRNGSARGIVMCFSAGNLNENTNTFFPANLDKVLGIIASDQNDSKASFSNYGVKFDVAAPGVRTVTTDLLGSAGYNNVSNTCSGATNLSNDYTYFAGTSASAPIVAGVCALLLAVEPRIPAGMGIVTDELIHPGIQYILQNTADKVGGYNYNYVNPGRSLEMGFGRINAYQAVLSALSWDPNNKIVTPLGCGTQYFIEPNETLTYTINFQNLGEGAATLVILKDTLDDDLDISTLQLLDSKHPYTFQILSGNIAEWTFDPIYLSPATVDNKASKGFVKYSILPKTIVVPGSKIENKTAIYFDQNEAVITNKVFNTISISPPPTASIAEGNQSICEGQTATFTASQGDAYLWNTGASTQSITANTSGNYAVRVSYNNACASSATATLTVHPNISNFTFNLQCNDNKYNFTYTGGLENPSLFWDFGSNATPSTSTQINPTGILFIPNQLRF